MKVFVIDALGLVGVVLGLVLIGNGWALGYGVVGFAWLAHTVAATLSAYDVGWHEGKQHAIDQIAAW